MDDPEPGARSQGSGVATLHPLASCQIPLGEHGIVLCGLIELNLSPYRVAEMCPQPQHGSCPAASCLSAQPRPLGGRRHCPLRLPERPGTPFPWGISGPVHPLLETPDGLPRQRHTNRDGAVSARSRQPAKLASSSRCWVLFVRIPFARGPHLSRHLSRYPSLLRVCSPRPTASRPQVAPGRQSPDGW